MIYYMVGLYRNEEEMDLAGGSITYISVICFFISWFIFPFLVFQKHPQNNSQLSVLTKQKLPKFLGTQTDLE